MSSMIGSCWVMLECFCGAVFVRGCSGDVIGDESC